MATLYIFGDSFSVPYDDNNPRVWTTQLADLLSKHTAQEIVTVNRSLVGSAQDYAIAELTESKSLITDQDYIVVVLTEPNRNWYFLERPDLSNSWILDLDQAIEPEQLKAIELYLKHIQNYYIDVMRVNQRLTWLAYQVNKLGWHRPAILLAFPQQLGGSENLEELSISNGSLLEIQKKEYYQSEEKTLTWRGIDPRYNHLCLVNHDVLAQKVFDTLINNQPLDLTQGFNKDILDVDRVFTDNEFVDKQLYKPMVEQLKQSYSKMDKIKTWRQRVGLD